MRRPLTALFALIALSAGLAAAEAAPAPAPEPVQTEAKDAKKDPRLATAERRLEQALRRLEATKEKRATLQKTVDEAQASLDALDEMLKKIEVLAARARDEAGRNGDGRPSDTTQKALDKANEDAAVMQRKKREWVRTTMDGKGQLAGLDHSVANIDKEVARFTKEYERVKAETSGLLGE